MRSKETCSLISANSSWTRALEGSPFAWRSARISRASASRLLSMSQRGDSGNQTGRVVR